MKISSKPTKDQDSASVTAAEKKVGKKAPKVKYRMSADGAMKK